MRIPSDPVTVFREQYFIIPLYESMRRGNRAMIYKSGNLLIVYKVETSVQSLTS